MNISIQYSIEVSQLLPARNEDNYEKPANSLSPGHSVLLVW
jgi:hypothetical protein